MSDIIDHINLIDGLNISPIPLEFGQEMTTTKWLLAIQAKVNSIIDMGNGLEGKAYQYTDDKFATLKQEYDELILLINSGELIPDNSIDLTKLKPTFITDLQETILNYVHNSSKFVTFGIDKKGYFYAVMPDSWSDLSFYTDIDGNLCMNILD